MPSISIHNVNCFEIRAKSKTKFRRSSFKLLKSLRAPKSKNRICSPISIRLQVILTETTDNSDLVDIFNKMLIFHIRFLWRFESGHPAKEQKIRCPLLNLHKFPCTSVFTKLYYPFLSSFTSKMSLKTTLVPEEITHLMERIKKINLGFL